MAVAVRPGGAAVWMPEPWDVLHGPGGVDKVQRCRFCPSWGVWEIEPFIGIWYCARCKRTFCVEGS